MKLIPRPFTLYALLVDTALWVVATGVLAVVAMKLLPVAHPVVFAFAAGLAIACGAHGVAHVFRAVRTYRTFKGLQKQGLERFRDLIDSGGDW